MIDRTMARRLARPGLPLASRAVPRAIAWGIIGLFFTLGGAGGCGLISLATLGTIASAAGSTVSTGQEIYSAGKLDTAEMQRPDDVALAVRKAALEMGLKRKPIPQERGVKDLYFRELEFLDYKGNSIKVSIDQRAERLVLLRIDVGLFGSQPTARLFLARIRAHLPGSASGDARSAG